MLVQIAVCVSVISQIFVSAQTDYCQPGMYLNGDTCVLTEAGYASTYYDYYACSSSVYEGAANCQATEAYVSLYAGGGSTYDGVGTSAYFVDPLFLGTDTLGNLYMTDLVDRVIRKITSTGGAYVTTFAGQHGVAGSIDGVGTVAQFMTPYGIVADSILNLYVADTDSHAIRKITSSAEVTTLYFEEFFSPIAIAVDSNVNVYASGSCAVKTISSSGVLTRTIGNGCGTPTDGFGTNVIFDGPNGLAVTSAGIVYVNEQADCTIHKIATDGIVTLFAGIPQTCGYADGPGTSAMLNHNGGITADAAGVVYVGDVDNSRVRSISTDGIVSSVAGGGTLASGFGTNVRIYLPNDVATTTTGMLYAVNQNDHTVQKISLVGYCPAGKYNNVPNTAVDSNCASVPAGYYKPLVAYSDVYYICPPGTYSTGGASVCTTCTSSSDSTSYGATSCTPATPSPSRRPTKTPSARPSRRPTQLPTVKPSRIPTELPTAVPSTEPSTPPPSTLPTLLPTTFNGFVGFDYGKSGALSLDDMNCFDDNGLAFFIPRGFTTFNRTGSIENAVDPHLCHHLEVAVDAGVTIKGIYVQPRNRYGLSYSDPITLLKRRILKSCSQFVDLPIWLVISTAGQFSDNNGWLDDTAANRLWFLDLVRTCKKYFGSSCGVMSTSTAWASVFGSSTFHDGTVLKGVPLWYSVDSSDPSFKDYSSNSVGRWKQSAMKQFQKNTQVCGHFVNLDWITD